MTTQPRDTRHAFGRARAVMILCGLLAACASPARAENDPGARFRGTGKADRVRIENVTRKPSGTRGAGVIAFDIAWDHSWRAAWKVGRDEHGGTGAVRIENWDAAWVFVKLRKKGADGWSHATLSKDRAHHTVPAGAALEVGLSDEGRRGVGLLLHRAAPGHGPNDWKGVTLRWMHAADGVPDIGGAIPSNEQLTVWLTGANVLPDVNTASAPDAGSPDLAGGTDDADLSLGGDVDRLLHGDNSADIQVHAVLMVHVPRGAFWAGDGTTPDVEGSRFWAGRPSDLEYSPLGVPESTIAGQFNAGGTTAPFRIESENAIVLGGESASTLNNNDSIGMRLVDDFNTDRTQALPAAFPKGYAGFYCMRHEIMQGQYVAFLNTIDSGSQGRRYAVGEKTYRNGIRAAIAGTPAVYRTDAPYVACNWLSWIDGAAYAAWAGLRPMTELEFEKACRGPLKPVANECAWGTDRIVGSHSGSGGYALHRPGGPGESLAWSGRDGPDAARGSAVWPGVDRRRDEDGVGPLRAGLFATPDSDRVRSGASYWGIMDLSGNLAEFVAVVGSAVGRGFAGTHGNGSLSSPAGWSFDADAPGDVRGASGFGSRGGCWSGRVQGLRVSSRHTATWGGGKRSETCGFRAVRTAP